LVSDRANTRPEISFPDGFVPGGSREICSIAPSAHDALPRSHSGEWRGTPYTYGRRLNSDKNANVASRLVSFFFADKLKPPKTSETGFGGHHP
jgi:hypothetical protein